MEPPACDYAGEPRRFSPRRFTLDRNSGELLPYRVVRSPARPVLDAIPGRHHAIEGSDARRSVIPLSFRSRASRAVARALEGLLHNGHTLLDQAIDRAGQAIRQEVRDPDHPAAPVALGEDL